MTQLSDLQPLDAAPMPLTDLQALDGSDADRPNIVERGLRGATRLANAVEGGSFGLSDDDAARIHAQAQSVESGLGKLLDPMTRALTDTSAPGAPPEAQNPQATGADIAKTALSTKTARDALVTGGAIGGSMLAGPEVGLGVGMMAAGAGGAGGSLAASGTVDPVANPGSQALTDGATAAAAELGSQAVPALGRYASKYVPNPAAAARAFADSFLGSADREEVGGLVQDALGDAHDAWHATVNQNYGEVQKAVGDAPSVDLAPALDKAHKLVEARPASLAAKRLRGWVQDTINAGDDGLVTFQQAQNLRSQFLRARGFGGGDEIYVGGEVEGIAKQLAGSVDSAMETTADAAGPTVAKLWRDANAFYKQGAQTFNDGLIQALADKQAPAVYDAAIRRGSPASIRYVRDTLQSPATWSNLQGLTANEWLREATSAETGELSGQKLIASMNPRSAYARDKMVAVFGADGADNMLKIARSLKRSQSADAALHLSWGKDGLGIGLAGGAAGLLLGHPLAGPAAALATLKIAPALTTKALLSPTFGRWLALSAGAKPGTRAAARAFAQIALHITHLQPDASLGSPSVSTQESP